MNRITGFSLGIMAGLLMLVAAVDFALLRSSQIASISIAPLVIESLNQDPAILTVVNRDGGMVCNEDEYLHLRVYLSGRIEGDGFGSARCQRKRRTALLDEPRLSRLRTALEQRALLNCKDKYPQYAVYTDTYTHSVISFEIDKQHKEIALTNPELDDPRNRANYPTALIDLLRQIEEITQHFEFR